jgi:hypothetical protein
MIDGERGTDAREDAVDDLCAVVDDEQREQKTCSPPFGEGGYKREKATGNSGSQSRLRAGVFPFTVIFIPMAGDELFDDFVPDEIVALSDDEQHELESDANDQLGPSNPPIAATESTAAAAKRKRRLKERERKAKVNIADPIAEMDDQSNPAHDTAARDFPS